MDSKRRKNCTEETLHYRFSGVHTEGLLLMPGSSRPQKWGEIRGQNSVLCPLVFLTHSFTHWPIHLLTKYKMWEIQHWQNTPRPSKCLCGSESHRESQKSARNWRQCTGRCNLAVFGKTSICLCPTSFHFPRQEALGCDYEVFTTYKNNKIRPIS